MRIAIVLLFAAIGCGGAERVRPTLHVDDAGLVPITTETGRALLARNLDDADAMPLLAHFESQRHGAHCGIASSVIALNTLGLVAPPVERLGPFRYFLQEVLIDDAETASVVPAARVNSQGMTLDQLGGILRAHGLTVLVTHGADIELVAFRERLRSNVERRGDVALVNYHRPALGQQGGGHISPVAAYDEETDRFLILDVAQYRYPPVWAKAEELWNAVRTVDSDSGLSRGIVEAVGGASP